MAASHAPKEIELKPGYYYAAVAVSLLPMLAVITCAIFGFGIHIGTFTLPYWLLILIGITPYYVASIFFIQTNEFGGITVLETPARELAQGPVYAPLLLTELQRFPRAMQQEQFPGEPEQISNLPDEETDRARSDLLKPIRITTGGPEQGPDAEKYKENLLNEQITFEPTFTVQWQVEQRGFFEFYVNIPGNNWAAKYRNLLKIMRDTGEDALNIIMSQHSAAWCISNKDVLKRELVERVSNAVSHWGIMVCEANVLNITPSHAVNVALGVIPTKKAERQGREIEAEGLANATRMTGQAEADVIVMKERARGEGLKQASEASGLTAKEIQQADIQREYAKNGRTTVINLDAGGLGKALMGGA